MTQTMTQGSNETVIVKRPTRGTDITEPLTREAVGQVSVSQKLGGVQFNNVAEVMDFARMMALADVAMPKHLRGNPGACLAIAIQALEWQISPFALANKSYSVNDLLSFEASLFHAVVMKRAPIKGRVKCSYAGEGPTRVCRVWAELADGSGETVEYVSPEYRNIKPKNSPLWQNDPDQQLFYSSVRAFSRRHFPDVMMGIYTNDELIDEQVPQASELQKRLAASDQPTPPAPPSEDEQQQQTETSPTTADASPAAQTTHAAKTQSLPESATIGGGVDEAEDQRPPVPETREQLVDSVATICGIEMNEAAALLDKAMVKPNDARWWRKFLRGDVAGMEPKKVYA